MNVVEELFGRVSEIVRRTKMGVYVSDTHVVLTPDGEREAHAVPRSGDLFADLERLAVQWAHRVRMANLSREANASEEC